MLHKLSHYARRIYAVGILNSSKIIAARFYISAFHKRFRKRALARQAHHQWHDIALMHNIDFSLIKNQLFQKSSLSLIDLQIDSRAALQRADNAVKKSFDLLGGSITFAFEINWYLDFRLQHYSPAADCAFDSLSYYADISYAVPVKDAFIKDIKVPWELSRLQHLVDLGYAFNNTCDSKYAVAAQEQFMSWYKANPFLIGVNWLCAMEVGIRAVNLVWTFKLFHQHFSDEILTKLAASIYDHMIYLENNWELYDGVTSNHYLSDLIGYLYCCFVFQQVPGFEKKINWCMQELLRELDKQIFDEGTDYEGSTSYHRLVTEMVYHAWLLSKTMHFSIPVQKKLEHLFIKMIAFLDRCITDNGTLLQIGDTDSGKLVAGISRELINIYKPVSEPALTYYKKFGLTIFKNETWHVTLRHHAYEKPQPSGHLHADAGSVTIAYKGIPIIVDPGSFVYTAHAKWRNRFRSASMHSIFYCKDREPIEITDSLFALAIPEHANDWDALKTSHTLYEGLVAERAIEVEDSIEICDQWLGTAQSVPTVWYFILHPDVKITEHRDFFELQTQVGSVSLYMPGKSLILNSWYSPSYGVKVATKMIECTLNVPCNTPISFCLK